MKKGFTLVELMVTISVVAVVVGGALFGISRQNGWQTVDQSTEKLISTLKSARANAMSGKKDCNACGAASGVCGNGDVPLRGWYITVQNTVEPNRIVIVGGCTTDPYEYPTPPAFTFPAVNNSWTLPNGVFATTNTASTLPVIFRTDGAVQAPVLPYIITIRDNSWFTRSITISSSGEITSTATVQVTPTPIPPTPTPTSVPPACLSIGDSCVQPSQCCTHRCIGNICRPAGPSCTLPKKNPHLVETEPGVCEYVLGCDYDDANCI